MVRWGGGIWGFLLQSRKLLFENENRVINW